MGTKDMGTKDEKNIKRSGTVPQTTIKVSPAKANYYFADQNIIYMKGNFIMGMPAITSGHATRCQAITDLIGSVALTEAGLAHILNAEGEKLQKAVSMMHITPEELLQVNKSAEQTIRTVTQLEIVLQSKLQLFQDCLCSNCPQRTADC